MALGKHRFGNQRLKTSRGARRGTVKKRNALLETLETRHLMAGPQLIGVQPDVGDLLLPGQTNVREVAPRELVFRFDDNQVIDAATLNGIRVTRSGGDGTFSLPSTLTDFGSAARVGTQIFGGAEVLLTGKDPDVPVEVTLNQTLAAGAAPAFSVTPGTRATISTPVVPTRVSVAIAAGTTVSQLVNAINASAGVQPFMSAELRGGSATSVVMLAQSTSSPVQTTLGPIAVKSSNDVILTPGAALVGNAPQQNEVTLRFADALPDDVYRIEVFGFDDPLQSITGLRNVGVGTTPGELLVPKVAGQRKEEVILDLNLGPRVEAVVPQPVVRGTDGKLAQRRNEILVYFNGDNLFTENFPAGHPQAGQPTDRSAENPRFYSLILTNETLTNLDELNDANNDGKADGILNPTKVIYNAGADTATLVFDSDLSSLFNGAAGTDTLRLRIGTSESLPLAPAPVNLGGRLASVNLTGTTSRLQLETIQEGLDVNVNFVPGATAGVVVSGGTVTVTVTAGQTLSSVAALINTNAAASAILVASVRGTGADPVSFGLLPVAANLLEVGGTFDTASSIGLFNASSFVSKQLNSAIDPQSFSFELIGGNDDPGHREAAESTVINRNQHINSDYGADVVRGITTIPYNFKSNYIGTRTNAISERQRDRVREALDLWGEKLGIQFVETADRGLTFARGDLTALPAGVNTFVRNDISIAVRVDPRLADEGFDTNTTNAVLVLDSLRTWQDRYGEDFFRTTMAGIGFLLGLEGAPELPANTLMALSTQFLSPGFQQVTNATPSYITNVGDQRLEPVFPGNADIIHGQYLYRPESNDVDLYRFEVALDSPTKLGELTVETFAERLPTSSLLDTTVTLYKQTQASLTTNFSFDRGVSLRLEAVASGLRGNRVSLQLVVTPTGPAAPQVVVNASDPNAIFVFTSNPAQISFKALADAINANAEASKLVKASTLQGDSVDPATVFLSNLAEDTLPQFLTGGKVEAIAYNDDYFSEDSLLKTELSSGVYYIAVAAQGNEDFTPVEADSGFGGKSQGNYQLLVKFRPQVDARDVIRDLDGNNFNTTSPIRAPGSRFDGDSDGVQNGIYNFWFQTRPLNRRLIVNGGDRILDGQFISIKDARGTERVFEFSTDGTPGANRIAVTFSPSDSGTTIAGAFANAIRNSGLQIGVNATGNVIEFVGDDIGTQVVETFEQSVTLSNGFTGVEVLGRTIFVDKDPSAGPQADGTLSRPFNNINSSAVPNAFAAARADDIVRIVGNGGADGNLATVGDNLAYQVGVSLLPNQNLEDGTDMEVPQGVNVMIDAGAVFKMRRGYVLVGSTSATEDRSESNLQVLGTPRLLDSQGRVATLSDGTASAGSVYFTSWLDETIGRDTHNPTTTPVSGDWGGIYLTREMDKAEGRPDLEDQGIFLQHVGFADIRYGGGKNVSIDGRQQVVNPIEVVNRRPTLVHNTIRFSADAAISASPDSFEETNFQAPFYQAAGAFTADYDRVGPQIYRNTLLQNSINGLFIRATTPVAQTLSELTVSSRFDDTDIVHYLAENLVVSGTPGSAIVNTVRAPVALVTGRAVTGGTLPIGTYSYRITYVDAFGNESLPSNATLSITTSAGKGAIELQNLPSVPKPFATRRLYRSLPGGGFDLVTTLDASDTRFIDTGKRLNLSGAPIQLDLTATERQMHRPDASIAMDPGLVVKLEGSRIEVEFGAQVIAEGTATQPVVLTSKFDDRYGAGGTMDTSSDGSTNAPAAGNWGGLYMAPTSHLSLDHVVQAYAGGLTRIEGTTKAFGPIELQQASARITNSLFQNNTDGQGGQGPAERFGRLANTRATIMARGSDLVLVGNTFTDNIGSPLDIDVGAFTAEYNRDVGRQTGSLGRVEGLDDNYGPLVRRNRFENNTLNGMEIRGAELTTETVFDDTDIVHVLYDEVSTGNFHSSGGLRLQSRPDESLVVKFAGQQTRPDGREIGPGSPYQDRFGTGLTAFGTLGDISDRIGGTLHIIGFPGAPVVLTSLADDTVGAGLRPDGTPQTDTNNDSFASRPRANDWRGVLLDQNSNDRNVETILESESPTTVAPGPNATTNTAQPLGQLSPDFTLSDETLRLGYTVKGFLSEPTDYDTYSFIATAGTEVWFDIDSTTYSLDSLFELLDAQGNVLARSNDSTSEIRGTTAIETPGLDAGRVGSLQRRADPLTNFNDFGNYDEFGTINSRDAGMRITLPGVTGTRSIYHVRVRSVGVDINDLKGGLTSGGYTLQLRLQEDQEFGGSTVRYADIRYSQNGVHLKGVPYHSPLLGDAQEDEAVTNAFGQNPTFSNDTFITDITQPGNRAQYIGNILGSDQLSLTVGGELSSGFDVDFYQFDVLPSAGGTNVFPAVIDLDYADELGRPDTNIAIYYDADGQSGTGLAQLVLFSQNGNISDDRAGPLTDALAEDFIRGSIGDGDPFIGSQMLPAGTYYIAISESSRTPTPLSSPGVRREPVTGVERIVEDHIESIGGSTAQPPRVPQFIPTTLPAGWTRTLTRSTDVGHGLLPAFDGSRNATGTGSFSGAVQFETETNDQINTADQLDTFGLNSGWSLGFDQNIGDSFSNTSTSIPHTSVYGTMAVVGSTIDIADVFQFTHAGGRFIADIDAAAPGLDTTLLLLSGSAIVATTGANPSFTASTALGAQGSISSADPYIEEANLPPGVYSIAVMPPGSQYNTQTGRFERAAPVATDNFYSAGSYILQISSEGHLVQTGLNGNQSLQFTPNGTGGQIETSAFSLAGYVAEDLPTLYFNYFMDKADTDTVTVRVVSDSNPVGTVIASSNGFGANVLTNNPQWRQIRVPLNNFAGQSGLRLQITYTENGFLTGREGLYLDDFIIGFAERGELVTGARPGEDSFQFSGFGGSVQSGTYQVEIRQGTAYGIDNGNGVTLTDSFDTNERQTPSVTLIAPQGNQIQQGDFFRLGDGRNSLDFEFTTGAAVQVGRIPVLYTATDSASAIAAAIIQAINTDQVQGILDIEAATIAGNDQGNAISGGARINIFGNPTGDFVPRIEQTFQVTPNIAAAQLAATLAGPNVQVSNAVLTGPGTSAGTFSGGGDFLGISSGVILSNGNVSTASAINTSDASTGTASGAGDPATDTAFNSIGVATSDSVALEFDVTIPAGSTSLFLQLLFASEEYSEDASFAAADIAAVYVNGIPVPVGVSSTLGTATSAINTDNYPSSSPFTTVNDPVSGGDFLDRFGYDGFTYTLLAAATGLSGTTHRVRIVVADNGANAVDSALLLAAGSLSTAAPRNPRLAADTTGRVVFPAIVSQGVGDQNVRREQGQILIHNNQFTEIAAYGVWTEPGDRLEDPEDNRNNVFVANANLGPTGIGAARNLRAANDTVVGGLAPGAYIANNVINNAGAAGIQVSGELRPMVISPIPVVDPEFQTTISVDGTHFGDFIPDGLTLTIDAGHTRVVFEFDDMSGDPKSAAPSLTLACGSGTSGGDGVAEGHVPVYYRKEPGVYLGRAHAYNEMETMHALRDAILGSILVTNGIVQLVDPEVGASLLYSSLDSFLTTGMAFSHPSLYVKGAVTATFSTEYTSGGVCNAVNFTSDQAGIHEGAQPFVRVVNNTIYGTDGNLNNTTAGAGVVEPNDTFATAIDTRQGRLHTPRAFTASGRIGDNSTLSAAQDVDFYSFSLDVGDRVQIDLDTNPLTTPVDTTLRLFNSRGEEVAINGELSAPAEQVVTTTSNPLTTVATVIDVASTANYPTSGILRVGNELVRYNGITPTSFTNVQRGINGTTATASATGTNVTLFAGIDGYLDYTATEKGIYYVGVSAKNNEGYDPFSLADRINGVGTGQYSISVEVLAPRTFVLTPDVNIGGDITITQIADIAGQTTNSVTINVDNLPGARPWDKAAALADLINQVAATTLRNHEGGNGPNGFSGPITRVEAAALGGANGDVPDLLVRGTVNGSNGGVPDNFLSLTTRSAPGAGGFADNLTFGRGDLFNADGFGHNRTGQYNGSSELHVWVRNAVRIDISQATGVRLDPAPGMNADQLIPQTGIMVTGGASPTVMNNVVLNTHGGLVKEVSRSAVGFGNTTVDLHPKEMEVIVVGNIFQGIDNRVDSFRQVPVRLNGSPVGFERGPSNINVTQDDFNFTLSNDLRLLMNAEAGNYLPAPNSPVIDSSIDSLLERDLYGAFKAAIGLGPSPILAPELDVFGQLRSDIVDVSSPAGLGGDVFKDRGAVERADFVGPVAELVNPEDNDSNGVDQDNALTIVRLPSGVATEFRIRLQDNGDAADPFEGLGVDDTSVVGPAVAGLRNQGAVLTLFENGRLLQEGIDYVFSYESLSNQIILTPLAGIFKPQAIYRIEINHKNRFVVRAPSGIEAVDESTITVTDEVGGRVLLEFETGYQIRLPSDLILTVPPAGGGTGGVLDGDRLIVELPDGTRTTFEFDSNENTTSTNIRVPFRTVDTQAQIAEALANVLTANAVGANGSNRPFREVRVQRDASGTATGQLLLLPGLAAGQPIEGVAVNVGTSAFDIPATALAIAVPPGLAVQDGETFTVSDGNNTVTFELDRNGTIVPGNIPVDIASATSTAQVAQIMAQVIDTSILAGTATVVAGRYVFLDLSAAGSATAIGPGLSAAMISRPIRDGQGFVLSNSTSSVRVEFDSNSIVPAGAISVPVTFAETNQELAVKVAAALTGNTTLASYGITAPRAYESLVSLRGNTGTNLTVDLNAPITSIGTPGVEGGTALLISGPLLLTVPSIGGVAINDGETFTITNNGVQVTFEMDVNNLQTNPLNIPVAYGFNFSADEVADSIVVAIGVANQNRNLGIIPVRRAGGIVELGNIDAAAVSISPTLPFTARPGTVADGERIILRNGTQSVTFEFESTSGGGGVTPGNTQVIFDPTGTAGAAAAALAAAINASGIGIGASAVGNRIPLVDTPQTRIDPSGATSITVEGVPGGAIPVPVVTSELFTAEDVKAAIIAAVNKARADGRIDLVAADRGADTFFLENALALAPEIVAGQALDSYYLRAVQDEAGNTIKSNQENDAVRFSIILPDAQFDFGDAPDPVAQVPGRYPTKLSSNGARHVFSLVGPRLGALLDAESDAQTSVRATGDDTSLQTVSTASAAGRTVFTVTTDATGSKVAIALPANATEAEDATLRVTVGGRTLTFVVDSDGQFNEDFIRVPFDPAKTAADLAASLQSTLLSSQLSLAGVTLVSGTSTVTIVSDDEDGIILGSNTAPTTVLAPGGQVVATITTTGPGVLSGWIDFNFDGDWDDLGEQVIVNRSVPSGVNTQTFVFTLPAGAATPADPNGAATMARFRIDSMGDLRPSGLALDGEVEDYSIRIVGASGGFVGSPDTFTVTEDNSLPISASRNVLSNDAARVGSTNLVFSADTGNRRLAHGNLVLNSNGTFTYTPDAEFFTTDTIKETFTYRLVDQTLLSVTGDLLVSDPVTVTINVTPVNDQPRRRNDPSGSGSPYQAQFTVEEDQSVTYTAAQVLQGFNGDPNDDIVAGAVGVAAPFDESGQELRLSIIGGATTNQGGTVQVLLDGSLSYTPAQNFSGADSFRVRVQDNGVPQRSVELEVSVFVVAANDRPVALDKSYSIQEDVTRNVLANEGLLVGASDPDGNTALLTVSAVNTTGTRGQVTSFTAQGAFTYVPPADFNGLDQFQYTVRDEAGGTTTRTVSINIQPVPDSPRRKGAGLPSITIVEDSGSRFVQLLDSFEDPDNDLLTFSVTGVTPAGKVTTQLSGPLLEIAPLADQFGQVFVTVTATDGTTTPFSQTLTVNITGVNDPPRLVGSGLPNRNVVEDEVIAPIPLNQFIIDPDGDTLTYRVVVNTNPGLVTPTITNGNLNLALVPNVSGNATLTIEASDGSQVVTSSFALTVSSAADAPTANPDAYTVARGGALDANVALDQTRTVTAGSGTLLLRLNSVSDLFVGMRVKGTATAIQRINTSTNEVTLTADYTGATVTFSGGILANDLDVDGNAISLVAVRVNGQDIPLTSLPVNLALGTLEFMASTGAFRYLNNSGRSGDIETFQYVIRDSTNLSSVGTVSIRIGAASTTHHNPLVINGSPGLDVSGDGFLSSIDALLPINLLNANSGSTSIPVRNLPLLRRFTTWMQTVLLPQRMPSS